MRIGISGTHGTGKTTLAKALCARLPGHALAAAELPTLRSEMNEALLELARDDPLDAWGDIPLLELSGPLDGRVGAVLTALGRP